jgi:hypothetical protein
VVIDGVLEMGCLLTVSLRLGVADHDYESRLRHRCLFSFDDFRAPKIGRFAKSVREVGLRIESRICPLGRISLAVRSFRISPVSLSRVRSKPRNSTVPMLVFFHVLRSLRLDKRKRVSPFK